VEDFGLVTLPPTYTRTAVFRGTDEDAQRTYSVERHESSIRELMRMGYHKKPVESEDHLRSLLVD
jgi:hypothetical protein